MCERSERINPSERSEARRKIFVKNRSISRGWIEKIFKKWGYSCKGTEKIFSLLKIFSKNFLKIGVMAFLAAGKEKILIYQVGRLKN